MLYKMRVRRRLFFRTFHVNGHRLEPALDKMLLYFADGSIKEIPEWSKCEVHLGTDWVAAMKESMEKQAGQAIPVAVG